MGKTRGVSGPVEPMAERQVVDRHERTVPPSVRRSRGVHYTPADVARRVTALALDAFGERPRLVADPCCGAGSFLLAAADELVRRGVDPVAVLARLVGSDIDAGAVAATREALRVWSLRHGLPADAAGAAQLWVGDAFGGPARADIDVVVGNPPFLSQLRSATRDHRRSGAGSAGTRVGPYTDASALFLLDAVGRVRPGGVVALLQPRSLLSARDAAPVRDAAESVAELSGLWVGEGGFADAEVHVCAPLLRRVPGPSQPHGTEPVVVHDDTGASSRTHRVRLPSGGRSWSPLLAPVFGVPAPPSVAPGGAVIGDVAAVTAGFRDEFYGIAAATREAPDAVGGAARVVPVGAVDLGGEAWGRRPVRIAGRSWTRPVLDQEVLRRDAPRVADWVGRRLVPKVLVATQTRVVEAAVDNVGDVVPLTPLISVEPESGGTDLWHLAAALVAPPVAARVVADHLGSGRSAATVRWSAAGVRSVSLPVEQGPWSEGARLLAALPPRGDGRDRPAAIERLGAVLCAAHGIGVGPERDELLAWWAPLAIGA
jgi:hypothetical protein